VYKKWSDKWIDKYLIFGIFFLIFLTFDFIIFSWFCLHHVFEIFGYLLIGFWLGDSRRAISKTRFIIAYIPTVIIMSVLISATVTLSGVLASTIISSPLLIGYLIKQESV